MKDARIVHPDDLENGHRYHVWYKIATSKTASGEAHGTFTDVFKGLDGKRGELCLTFYEHSPINWLTVTAIRKWEPGDTG